MQIPALLTFPHSLDQTVIDIRDFDVDETGANSSHAGIQDAIDAAKAVARGPGYGAWAAQRSGTVLIPKGNWAGVGSLDCTNCVGLTIKGQGSWGSALYADGQTTAAPVLDFAQSSYCRVEDMTIHGSDMAGQAPAVTPNSAVLLADSDAANGSSNKNFMREVNCFGHFENAALAIYRSTNNNFVSCALHNDRLNGAALFVGTVNNVLPVVSLYQPLAGSGFAANEALFTGCEFHGARTDAAQMAPVWLAGAQTATFLGGIIDSNGAGQPCVYFPVAGGPHFFHGTKFYTENGTPPGSLFNAAAAVQVVGEINKHSAMAGVADTVGPVDVSNLAVISG